MKRTLLPATLALVLCLCGTANLGKYPRVNVPPFPDGETEVYRVMTGPDEVGIYVMTVHRGEFRGLPVFRLDLVSRTLAGSVPTVDSSTVFVTRDSMVPVSTFRFLRTGNALVTTATNYAPGSVAIATYSPQEEKQRLLPFGQFTYDYDQLTFLGRALEVPNAGKPVEIKVISPMGPPVGGAVIDGLLGVGPNETITVPAGTFDCYKLVFNLGPRVVVMWFERTGSHRMIRSATPGGTQVLELIPTDALPMSQSTP